MDAVIDTHQHLWDLSRFDLPWLSGGGPLARSHSMEEYLRESEGLGVAQTLYMEVDVHPSQHVREAEEVLALCARSDSPMAGAVIGGRPAEEGFAAYLDRFAGNPHLKGVRQVLHGSMPRGFCLRPEFIRGVRLLGERGLRFDICIRPDELEDAAALIAACPDTRFILDHCGNADVRAGDLSEWQRGMESVARRPNVVCKVSGIVASAAGGPWSAEDLAPIIQFTADAFGRERIMFGSDWPVCTLAATYRQWVEALKQIVSVWPESDRRRLFHDNAAAFYRLRGE